MSILSALTGGNGGNKEDVILYAPEYMDLLERYFLRGNKSGGGCLGGKKLITDNEYYNMVMQRKAQIRPYERALGYLGIDDSSVQEIPPVEFEGFVRGVESPLSVTRPIRPVLRGYSGLYTNIYEDTWFFFTESQILIYQLTFDMLSRSIKDESREIFYKDVTSFAVLDLSEEVDHLSTKKGCMGTKVINAKGIDKFMTFRVVVPGEDSDNLDYVMTANRDLSSKIHAMQQKLREKKNFS